MRRRTPGVETSLADDHIQALLGLFVLGGATPEERRLVSAHLGQCESCRAAHDDIKDLPSALAIVTGEDLATLARTPTARRRWSRPWRRSGQREDGLR
jgi:predicted anti-sigma-YlaC factor YlaD